MNPAGGGFGLGRQRGGQNSELLGLAAEQKDDRGRRRFSIAHECGHAVLRHKNSHYLEFTDPSAFGEPPEYSYRDEREANGFAAALLMDASWLRKDCANFSNISKLARRYQVSEEAMSFRLMNLGLV